MTKLITAYLTEPSLKNARKLRNYAAKHPMTLCTLSHLEMGLLRAATVQVAEGR